MRDFDHPGAPGKFLDQCVGGRAVIGVEVGVPFVEQIDRRRGVTDNFLKRAELPFAG